MNELPENAEPALVAAHPAAPVSLTSPTSSLDALAALPLHLRAVLGRVRLPLGRLAGLTEGEMIEFDQKPGDPVDIMVHERLVARGELVMVDGQFGVTLTEIVGIA